jgi:hypothetical protein
MPTRSYVSVSATVFAIVAIAHLARAIADYPLHIGAAEIPMWVSWMGTLGAGALSAWGFSSLRPR